MLKLLKVVNLSAGPIDDLIELAHTEGAASYSMHVNLRKEIVFSLYEKVTDIKAIQRKKEQLILQLAELEELLSKTDT